MKCGRSRKILWFCGGHGICNDPYGPDQPAAMLAYTLAWMTQYVKQQGTPAAFIPVFEWFDQKGARFNSSSLPFQEAFNDLPDARRPFTQGERRHLRHHRHHAEPHQTGLAGALRQPSGSRQASESLQARCSRS